MKPDAEGLHPIANTENPDRKADIVFVHGLGGSSHATWRHGKVGKTDHFFWPEELGKSRGDCGIWSVGYPAGFSQLGKQGMIIEKRAGNIADTLSNGGLGNHPIILITHSMGGLIVKSLIVESQLSPSEPRKKIVGCIRGVVFCATPHNGSGFAEAAKALCFLAGGRQAHTKEMIANAENLNLLHGKFIEWHRQNPIAIESYAENQKLSLTRWLMFPTNYGVVVPRGSANPNISGCEIHDSDDDHLTIVKPRNQKHNVYAGVLKFIDKSLKSADNHILATAPRSEVMTAPVDISRIIKYAPEELIGREVETTILSDAWNQAVRGETKRPRILTFVAFGGEGKTSLVAKWAAELAHQDWPGCEAVFAWSFYSQGSRESASSDIFLSEALAFFEDEETASSNKNAFEKGRRLAQLVGTRRALLVLDGIEPLQYSPTSPLAGELSDRGLAALLKGLAANNQGLCVVTTRYSIPDLKAYRQTTAIEHDLKRLSTTAGVALLKTLGVGIGSKEEFEHLVEDVKGHALTLTLLGSYLYIAHTGDIRKRSLVMFEEADAEIQGGHAFRVIESYERWFKSKLENRPLMAVLRLTGLFERHIDLTSLEALCKAPAIPGLTEPLVNLSEAQLNISLERIRTAKLITVNRNASGELLSIDAHPLIREYFAGQLRKAHPGAWRAAHLRLYEHLCATTIDKPRPTLVDIQPLYEAVAHGCYAGIQKEAFDKVYQARIQRGEEHYSADKLGAFGSDLVAVTCFFDNPWSRVSAALPPDIQIYLLNEAATRLQALCRPLEALIPMRAGLERLDTLKERMGVARMSGNMSDLELTLGKIEEASVSAKNAVMYATLNGNLLLRLTCLGSYADVLHHAGKRTEANACFIAAEALQRQFQPSYPLLHSMVGFQYCDFLLSGSERTAWQGTKSAHLLAVCQDVSRRAVQTLVWVQNDPNISLLSIAVAHLALGRSELYAAILDNAAANKCMSSLENAVDGLRSAGQKQFIPLGLLSRAWQRSLAGARIGLDSAQSDLDEAWDISERGAMPLFMADIHLYRARLFFKEEHYPWDKNEDCSPRGPKDDLAEARRLIEKHGYWRRKEELEDAEKAIIIVHE